MAQHYQGSEAEDHRSADDLEKPADDTGTAAQRTTRALTQTVASSSHPLSEYTCLGGCTAQMLCGLID